ncbi:YfjI family protein [Planctomycetaceae bacterium]|nr:YfjI family protein [Planctomycetaceae bacterium]
MPNDRNGTYFEESWLTPPQTKQLQANPEEFIFEPLTDTAKSYAEEYETKNRNNGYHAETPKSANRVYTTPSNPEILGGSVDVDAVDVPEFIPFPTYALHGAAGALVKESAKSIGCDEAMIAVPVLACISASIGRSRCLVAKPGWVVPPILWQALVAESGSSKTPAIRQALKPLKKAAEEMREEGERLQEQYESAIVQYESELVQWKKSKNKIDGAPQKPPEPQMPRLTVSDATIEALAPILQSNPRGLLVERDELASWLGSFDAYKSGKGADAGSWLSMHSGEGFTVDRKTGQRNIHVRAGAVSILGGIQPGILKKHLAGANSQSGLSARLLMVSPPRSPKSWSDDEVSEGTVRGYQDLVDSLLSLMMVEGEYGPDPVLVGMSSGAKSIYEKWYDSHNEEAFQLTGELAAAYSKIEELPLRLSLILHCCYHHDTTAVSTETMEAAIALSNWYRSEAIRVRLIMSGLNKDSEDDRLLKWILNKGGSVSSREAQQGCRWLKTSEDTDSALQGLVESGKGQWEQISPGSKGGRATRMFTASTSTQPP